jgi:hypothetical protein
VRECGFAISRAKLVRSDAQSRNADRKPCTVTPDFRRRMVISNTMFDIGLLPDRPGKTNSLPAASNLSCLSNSMHRGARGTRCSLPRLHSAGRDRPGRLLQIDFVPSGLQDLTSPGCRLDQELKG